MSEYKIMIVDDEPDILDLLEKALTIEGFHNILKVDSGNSAVSTCKKEIPDVIILDVMLPDIDGYEVCKRIRQFSHCPILFLSSKNDEVDKILGLAVGGDDYVTKPFNPLELMARVKSQLRRYRDLNPAREQKKEAQVIELRNLIINREIHQVFVDGESIKLTPIEFDILHLLASNPGKVFSTDEIFEQVWHEKVYEANNTVMVHIRRLRGKMKDDSRTDKIITTVWGVGYKIDK